MNEKITKFEVSNFKKFDHLVVDNLGQINLITGDNNVGKTCFLEALVLNNSMKDNVSFLWHCLMGRNFFFDPNHSNSINDIENNYKNNIIGLVQKDLSKPITLKQYVNGNLDLQIAIENQIIDVINIDNREIREFAKTLEKYPEIHFLSKNWGLFYLNNKLTYMIDFTSKYYNQFFYGVAYAPLISIGDFYRDDLVRIYNDVVKSVESKDDVLKVINRIFPNDKVIDIIISTFHGVNHLSFATENNKQYHSIANYGSGYIRIIRIVLEIILCAGKKLMIDEIDTGIHYLRMKNEWEIIFRLAKQYNTQIFATTHSADCIKAFIEAGEQDEEIKNNLRLIELEEYNTKNNTKKNSATTYGFEALKFKFEAGTNIRGGNVWQ